MNSYKALIVSVLLLAAQMVSAQQDTTGLWHGKKRALHYRPDGNDFVLVNGTKRFNRALYGTNTGFRIEAGDLPEFALYLPGMGGNLKFGIISGESSKWIIDAKSVETRYRPGSMIYTIRDPLLGSAELKLSVLAEADAEGLIIKAEFVGKNANVELFWAFGGATAKKFSRDGDIGADPESSFYLKPENCKDNAFRISNNSFKLNFGSGKVLTETERYEVQQGTDPATDGAYEKQKQLSGLFPLGSKLQLANAEMQQDPLSLSSSKANTLPVLTGRINANAAKDLYFLIQTPGMKAQQTYSMLPGIFAKAEATRETLANRIIVSTPDKYINTLGGALGVAADAIWEDPTYLHGAVAWRMRLNAWRGASAADALGWHDRAKTHLSSYENSQVLVPASGPITPDTARNFARQEERIGTAVFSSGYISRHPNNNKVAHHYDMNLVFFDQMFSHFNWTGDLSFAREMWPAIKRHLAWEKRNFDMDGDGLYDAYAAIWASDALQYSGGGVTHSSAYNYRANLLAAKLAKLLNDDSAPYQNEADKILAAMNANLWLKDKGWFAEYKDIMGLKLVHPFAGLWSVYHALDSDVPDPFQAYQALRYIDTEIPHIPIKAEGLLDKEYYTLSTTNWQPYTWSLNNVALAEVLHTSLAYWQAGRSEDAFKLWESMIIESMYLSSSPGGFEQLSFYDSIRGELYRDFADPIGMASRSLVEGLFGIRPDALHDTLTIRPGFPADWDRASIKTPDIDFDFKRTGSTDRFVIRPSFPKSMNLQLAIAARLDQVDEIKVNGKRTAWKNIDSSVGRPQLLILAGKAAQYTIEIEWSGDNMVEPFIRNPRVGQALNIDTGTAQILQLFDPQKVLSSETIGKDRPFPSINSSTGHHTVFAKLRQGQFTWWAPLDIDLKDQLIISIPVEPINGSFAIEIANAGPPAKGQIIVNKATASLGADKSSLAFKKDFELPLNGKATLEIPISTLQVGTNTLDVSDVNGNTQSSEIVYWDAPIKSDHLEKIDLKAIFNDHVTNIYKNKYLSPRPASATLQLPLQGIGNWCYPLIYAEIDDSGLRKAATGKDEIRLPNGLPFQTPSSKDLHNIVFTSKWDNYPDSVRIPLSGKASHAYFLMAGSTNAMQSRLDNAEILISYKDGTSERLALRNPETWWPIEQDYYIDDYAFKIDKPRPYRVRLKTAEMGRSESEYYTIKGFSSYGIDGGAATVLDLILDPSKELQDLKLKTLANEVVIGLMGLTLQR